MNIICSPRSLPALLLVFALPLAEARIIKCVHPDGRLTFSDRPCAAEEKSEIISEGSVGSFEASGLDPERRLPEGATAEQLQQELQRTQAEIRRLEKEQQNLSKPFDEDDMKAVRAQMYQACLDDPQTTNAEQCAFLKLPISPQLSAAAMQDRHEQLAAVIRREQQRLRALEALLSR